MRQQDDHDLDVYTVHMRPSILAKMHSAQWVTLHNIYAYFLREMWFIDCSYTRM